MATWLRALPQKEIDAAIQTMPNVAADLTTTDTYLFQAHFTNTTNGSVTIKLLDKQNTPKTILSDQASLAAGNTAVFAWPQGLFCKGGINWVCSNASAVDAQLYGFTV